MRKIKIKEIVCIIGLLGTLTAHSQNTVWQIGNKDKSAKTIIGTTSMMFIYTK